MNKEECIKKLQEVKNTISDTEHAHAIADDVLLEYIADSDIKAAYDAIDKWYA